MMSLVRMNDNDISFTDHVHGSVTVHEKKFTLKDCHNALEIELSPWQPSLRFDRE